MWSASSERNEICLGDKFPPGRRNRTELGHRDTIARNDEGLPGGYRVDHLGVVVAQLPLCDGLRHEGECSTERYKTLQCHASRAPSRCSMSWRFE